MAERTLTLVALAAAAVVLVETGEPLFDRSIAAGGMLDVELLGDVDSAAQPPSSTPSMSVADASTLTTSAPRWPQARYRPIGEGEARQIRTTGSPDLDPHPKIREHL